MNTMLKIQYCSGNCGKEVPHNTRKCVSCLYEDRLYTRMVEAVRDGEVPPVESGDFLKESEVNLTRDFFFNSLLNKDVVLDKANEHLRQWVYWTIEKDAEERFCYENDC